MTTRPPLSNGSPLDPQDAIHDHVVVAEAPWSHLLATGQTLRIIDTGGQQAVDFLLYAASDTSGPHL